jgi:hypothetical protein
MDFEQEFRMARDENRRRVMKLTYLRIMETQRRAKIKPSEMNPVLLNLPLELPMQVGSGLNLYWPGK